MKVLKSSFICGSRKVLKINWKGPNIQNGQIKGSSIENVLKHVLCFSKQEMTSMSWLSLPCLFANLSDFARSYAMLYDVKEFLLLYPLFDRPKS